MITHTIKINDIKTYLQKLCWG